MVCGDKTRHPNEENKVTGGVPYPQPKNSFKPFDYDNSEIQRLMTTAYNRWEKRAYMTYEQFVESLPLREKMAVVFGNLNYQVHNGGFLQWDDNGYSVCSPFLVEFLGKLPEFGPQVAALVKHCSVIKEEYEEELAEYRNEYDDWSGDYPDEPDPDDFEDEDAYREALDEYNDEYNEYLLSEPDEPELYFEYRGKDPDTEYYARADQVAYEIEAIVKMSDEELEGWWNSTPSIVPSIGKVLFNEDDKPPIPKVKLTGTDGNVFAVRATMTDALKKFDQLNNTNYLNEFTAEWEALDQQPGTTYDNMLGLCFKYAEIR